MESQLQILRVREKFLESGQLTRLQESAGSKQATHRRQRTARHTDAASKSPKHNSRVEDILNLIKAHNLRKPARTLQRLLDRALLVNLEARNTELPTMMAVVKALHAKASLIVTRVGPEQERPGKSKASLQAIWVIAREIEQRLGLVDDDAC
jgi:hypothetical protein